MAYPKTDQFFDRCMSLLTYDEAMGVFMQRQTNKDKTVSWLEPAGTRIVYGIRLRIDSHEVFAHHLVWRMAHGAWPEHHVKHKDRDVGNNRLGNLHTPGKDRKKPKASPLVNFMMSLGVSERQLKRIKIENVRTNKGDAAAIDTEYQFGLIDKEERDRQLDQLRENP